MNLRIFEDCIHPPATSFGFLCSREKDHLFLNPACAQKVPPTTEWLGTAPGGHLLLWQPSAVPDLSEQVQEIHALRAY